LPNYLEMISGEAYEASGTANDCTPPSCGPVTGTNVTDQLAAAGIRQGDSKIADGSCVVTMSSKTARASEARRQLPWSSS